MPQVKPEIESFARIKVVGCGGSGGNAVNHMVNKKVWAAHKHRDFRRSHRYPNNLSRASWDFALAEHGDYYQNVVYKKWFT